jgi:hypothetical protein
MNLSIALGARPKVVVGFLLAAACAAPLPAFKISVLGRVHERMTRLAEQCDRSPVDTESLRCDLPIDRKAFSSVKWKLAENRFTVRWPDDPTDQALTTGGVKFVVNVGFDNCRRHLARDVYAGIMCHSHYGDLQFMHAMTPRSGVDFATTRTLVLDWARFAFGVSTGRIGGGEDFCQAARRQPERLARALAPERFPFCGAEGRPRWLVSSFFTFRCDGLFSSGKCKTGGGDPEGDARAAARGALLHLIQDSYSQSHTARAVNDPDGPYEAAITCQRVTAFYDYNVNHGSHKPADSLPRIDEGCRAGGPVLDPITASARMLRYLREGAGAEDRAIRMLDQQVLG